MSVTVSLPLDKMSTADKIATMERLWDDLCRHPEDVPVPSWHKQVLLAREKRVVSGKGRFLSVAAMKSRIRKATR